MSDLPAARLRNMDARRARILHAASGLLAAGGLAGLTVREVATQAGVTVPTIYNLIGAKDQLITALIAAALDRLDQALAALPEQRGLARAHAAVHCSADLFLGAPAQYGAMFRAVQEIQAQPAGATLGPLFRRAGDIYCHAVREAQKDGDLHGRLAPVPLGHHILHCQLETFRLWALGALSPEAARARAYYAVYVSLMADATKQGRRSLVEYVRDSENALDN
jgi:AcrR family transcriptional regulator